MTGHKIVISGSPIPWAPSRLYKGRHYNPKAKLKLRVISIIKSLSLASLEGPIRLDITFYMEIPLSYSKKLKEKLKTTPTYHTKKPDRTNLIKFIEDCLEKAGIIKNDSCVVQGEAKKIYSDKPRTEIYISEINKN